MTRLERGARRRIAALALAALVAAACGCVVQLTGAFSSLEQATIATRFSLRTAPRPSGIVIVKIDDRTFGELAHSWPFPRSWHGRVIDRLRTAGAREIVYDVQFTEPSQVASQDLALYHAIARAGNVTLATSESDAQGRTNVLGGDANLARAHARAAAANLSTSSGGVVTRFPRSVSGLESLAVVAAERATGRRLPAARFPGGEAWIDYRGGAGTFPSVSYSAVLRGRVPAATFRGKIVVVGATSPTLQDVHATPVSGDDLMSGPEVQANAIWTALHRNPLRSAPDWLGLLAMVLLALIAPLCSLRLSVVRSMIVALSAGIAYVVAAQIAFDHGSIITVTTPLVALVVGVAAMGTVNYLVSLSDRRLLGWTVRRRTEQLRDVQLEIVTRLAQAAESRDTDTGRHIERIGLLCERLARRIGMHETQARMLRHASAMHDVGKIAIPDRVLLKPGPLDAEEWAVMKTHAARGAEILTGSTLPLVQMAEQIARSHHERFDGTGYPDGLSGEEIPLVARICSVCDVFDALISRRPYKEPWPQLSALDEIAAGSGSHFDPQLAAAFIEMITGSEHEEFELDMDAIDLSTLPGLGAPDMADGDHPATRRGTKAGSTTSSGIQV